MDQGELPARRNRSSLSRERTFPADLADPGESGFQDSQAIQQIFIPGLGVLIFPS